MGKKRDKRSKRAVAADSPAAGTDPKTPSAATDETSRLVYDAPLSSSSRRSKSKKERILSHPSPYGSVSHGVATSSPESLGAYYDALDPQQQRAANLSSSYQNSPFTATSSRSPASTDDAMKYIFDAPLSSSRSRADQIPGQLVYDAPLSSSPNNRSPVDPRQHLHSFPNRPNLPVGGGGGSDGIIYDAPPSSRRSKSNQMVGNQQQSQYQSPFGDQSVMQLIYDEAPPPPPSSSDGNKATIVSGENSRRIWSPQGPPQVAGEESSPAFYLPTGSAQGSRMVMRTGKSVSSPMHGGLPPVSPGLRGSPHERARKTYHQQLPAQDPEAQQQHVLLNDNSDPVPGSRRSRRHHRRANSASALPQQLDAARQSSTIQSRSIRSSGIGSTSRPNAIQSHRRSISASDVQDANNKKSHDHKYAQSSPTFLHHKSIRSSGIGSSSKRSPSHGHGHRRAVSLNAMQPLSEEDFLLSGANNASSPSLLHGGRLSPRQSPKQLGRKRSGSTEDILLNARPPISPAISPSTSRKDLISAGGGGGTSKPRHRRTDSASSMMSVNSAMSEVSVASYVSDIKNSTFFRGVDADTGDVQLHLPIDNIQITTDPDLESGVIYKYLEENEDELFSQYHLASDPASRQGRIKGGRGGGGGGMDVYGSETRALLPDPRYVINIDSDIYKRVLSEIADSRDMPCGLYYCGHHEDVDRPSISIAAAIVIVLFMVLLGFTFLYES